MQEVLDFALGITERLPLLLCQKHGQIIKLLLDDFNTFQNQLRPRFGRSLRPWLERRMRRIDASTRIVFGTFRRRVHDFPCGGIDHVVRLPGT